ncbi:hypothetical protein Bpfe_013921, partial [Biomphalaria pfeifferi]
MRPAKLRYACNSPQLLKGSHSNHTCWMSQWGRHGALYIETHLARDLLSPGLVVPCTGSGCQSFGVSAFQEKHTGVGMTGE